MDLEQKANELLEIAEKIANGCLPEYMHDELYTVGAFDGLLFNMREPHVLFELLTIICRKYEEIGPKKIKGYLYLLSELSYATKTTELPVGMENIISENKKNKTAQSIAEWYRIKL